MDALESLADPTRRSIVEMLSTGEAAAGEIAEHFHSSRPAVSRHLRVLREAGLVSARSEGTRRIYRVDLDGLVAVQAWFDQRLDALATELRRSR